METIISISKIFLVLLLIITPVFTLKTTIDTKYSFIKYLFYSIVFTSIIMLFLAWCSYYSLEILLYHYDYAFEPMNIKERFTNVSDENIDRVNSLLRDSLGVGWPLKDILFRIDFIKKPLKYYL